MADLNYIRPLLVVNQINTLPRWILTDLARRLNMTSVQGMSRITHNIHVESQLVSVELYNEFSELY